MPSGGRFCWLGVPPDEIGLNTGVTLLGDGGTAGPANFDAFKKLVIEPTRTEVLCFLNITKAGLIALPEFHSPHDIDLELSKQVVEANRDILRGIKGVEMAKKLASDLKIPLMMHIGEPRDRMEKDWMRAISSAIS